MADLETIRLKQNSAISDVIDEMQKTSAPRINFEVPEGAVIFQDVINLKIIQKKAEELGKEILISQVKQDESAPLETIADGSIGGVSLAEAVTGPVDVVPPFEGENESLVTEKDVSAETEEIVKSQTPVSGIVKKETMVDLRAARPRKIIPPSYNPTHPIPPTATLSAEEMQTARAVNGVENFSNLDHPALKKFATTERNPLSPSELSARRAGKIAQASAGNYSYAHHNRRSSRLSSSSARILAVFLLLALLTAGFVLFMVLPKATVAVTMQTVALTAQQDFTTTEEKTTEETQENLLPVESKTFESQMEKTFPATGVKKLTEKAKGEIVIYNECSTAPQTLVAGTRFLSRDGKTYTLDAGVNVSGFNKPDDVITAGQMRAKVTATEAGEVFNIGPTSFTIPKLQETGSWKYNCLYAKSSAAMAGGSTKEVKIVSQEDLEKAGAEVTKLLQAENERKIADAAQTGIVMVFRDNSAGEVKLSAGSALGTQVDQFKMSGSIKQKNIGAQQATLEKLVEKNLKTKAKNPAVEIVPESLKYELQSVTLDPTSGKISGSLHSSGKITYKLNQEEVKKAIAGKKQGELAEYFKRQEGVASVNATFWPFWVNKVPADPSKIHLTIDTKEAI